MIKRSCLCLAILGLGIMSALTAAEAATLQSIQGEVLVSHGNGYSLVRGSAQLNAGDSVFANPGGAAKIVYEDGCVVAVEAGSVLYVGPSSPCIETGSVSTSEASPIFEVDGTTLVIGGAVVGSGALAWALLSGDDGEEPASP